MGAFCNAVTMLKSGIGGEVRFKDFVEARSGQAVTVGTDLRNSTPPCVLISYENGEVSGPMKTGGAVFRIRAVFPFFGDALSTALEAVDLLVEDIYFGVGRSVDGVRLSGPILVRSIAEMVEQPGMWDVAIDVQFDF